MASPLNWDDLQVFLAVARAGTLSGAARMLDAGVATVARRIERLEAALAVPLFARHQTGYRLTDQGRGLVARAQAVESAVLGLHGQAQSTATVAGQVRLATVAALVGPIIAPALAPLLEAYPQLCVEILTDALPLNLHRGDADLAIRMVCPEHGHLVRRRLGTVGYGLYGAPNYLDQRGNDASFADDRLIGWSTLESPLLIAEWLYALAPKARPCYVANALGSQLAAAQAGIGLTILPHFLARASGLRLVCERLPDGALMAQPLWLVMHADLAASRRVRVIADCLAAAFAGWRTRLACA